jgi:ubiquinone/menaquinone biosynthesis C-methylase UbiE
MSTDARPAAARQWAMGDYPAVARHFLGLARHLVDIAGVREGERVADLAAGTGNVAREAARRGAVVEASDITPELVEDGRGRCAVEGLEVSWAVADVQKLPYENSCFDRALSALGTMFGPDPAATAAEAFRVLRPGGTFAMASWTPDGYLGRLGDVLDELAPPPPDAPPRPVLWGDEAVARERLAPHAADIGFARGAVRWEFPSLDEARAFQERSYPNLVSARETMPPDRYADLIDTMMAFAAEHNLAADGRLVNDVEYLIVVATKPAA